MRALTVLALPLLLAACGGGATYGEGDVQGTIGPFSFGDELTAYHGTSFIVLVDRKMDCLDMSWVTRNYFGSNEATSDQEFLAVQFSFAVDESPSPGTYIQDAESEAPIDAWRLFNSDVPSGSSKAIDAETGEEYRLTVDSASEDAVIGSFEATFVDGTAAGTFETVHCRNVR